MEADKIDELPGQPKGVHFDQYAGYVAVDPKGGRALFYYFVEAPNNASTKPLVLWLNGGPGCSSLGAGAMTELGPFRPNRDGKTLHANEYAWNNVANVIFLESPVGVGFSYSKPDDGLNGDKSTAEDSYTFLVNWLERFPQYKSRDFFITGESYSGHYVPQLAATILQNNKITNRTVINLKGIAIGNAYVDRDNNEKAKYNYYWGHALISDETYKAIQSNCNFSDPSIECRAVTSSADTETGVIDPYNIYAPVCDVPTLGADLTRSSEDADPCLQNYAATYLNLPEVQNALHVAGAPRPWSLCSDSSWADAPATMLQTIKGLIADGMPLWLFSGDQDSVVPVTATKDFINVLGLPVKGSWRPWYTDNEVGGYVVDYKGLTFATVRGAGHMVPNNQPKRALTLISSFLQGKLPPGQ